MKVKLPKPPDSALGVKRAVDKVYQLIEEGTHPNLYIGADHP